MRSAITDIGAYRDSSSTTYDCLRIHNLLQKQINWLHANKWFYLAPYQSIILKLNEKIVIGKYWREL